MGFTLNCSSDVLEAISREAEIAGISRTQYINRLLERILQMPRVLTSGTALDELEAHSRLFEDEVLGRISAIAQKERRSIDQMLLHLVEIGLAARGDCDKCSENPVRLRLVPPLEKE